MGGVGFTVARSRAITRSGSGVDVDSKFTIYITREGFSVIETSDHRDGDPAGGDQREWSPGWDEAEFGGMVRELVADTAPRLFALVEECGEREDGWVFAWGAQFTDRATLLTHDGRPRGIFGSAERPVRRSPARQPSA